MVDKSSQQKVSFSLQPSYISIFIFWHFSLPSGRSDIGFSGLAIAMLVCLAINGLRYIFKFNFQNAQSKLDIIMILIWSDFPFLLSNINTLNSKHFACFFFLFIFFFVIIISITKQRHILNISNTTVNQFGDKSRITLQIDITKPRSNRVSFWQCTT